MVGKGEKKGFDVSITSKLKEEYLFFSEPIWKDGVYTTEQSQEIVPVDQIMVMFVIKYYKPFSLLLLLASCLVFCTV